MQRMILQHILQGAASAGLAVTLLSCNQSEPIRTQVVVKDKSPPVASANQAVDPVEINDTVIKSPAADPGISFIQNNLLGTVWQNAGTSTCRLQTEGDQTGLYFKNFLSFVDFSQYIMTSIFFSDAACTVPKNTINPQEKTFTFAPSDKADEWKHSIKSFGQAATYTTLKFAGSRFYVANTGDALHDGLSEETRFIEIPTDLWFEKVGGTGIGSEATALELVNSKLLGRVFRFNGTLPGCRSDYNRIFYDTSITFITPTTMALTWTHYKDSLCTIKTGTAATQYYNFTLTPSNQPQQWLLDWGSTTGDLSYTLFKIDGDRFYLGKDDPIQDGSTAAKRPTELSMNAWYQSVHTLSLPKPASAAPPLK